MPHRRRQDLNQIRDHVERDAYSCRDEGFQTKLILPKLPVLKLLGPLTCHNERYTFCIAMRFEWDSEKSRINQQKHGGIAFASAALVFNDPQVVFRKDRIVTGEQRWHAIGVAEGAVLLVVRVYRMENENWRRRNHPHHLGPRS